MSDAPQAITFCRWADPRCAPFAEPVFLFDRDDLPESLVNASVVLREGGVERAHELLARSATRVLLGDAALKDSSIIAPLAKEIGAERLGLWVPIRRMSVSWVLDTESNADFRCVAPSRVKAAWEVMLNNGSATGTDATWWIAQMLAHASMALIAADLNDHADLNICAEMTEQHGPRLWLTPLSSRDTDLRPWIHYGHVHNLVVPGGISFGEEAMAALLREFSPTQQEIAAA